MTLTLQDAKTSFAKRSFYVFSGRVLPVIVLFLITILYSRKLSYDDYGTFQSVWMYANIINVIISFGFISILLTTNLSFLLSFIERNRSKIITWYSLLIVITFLLFFYFSRNFSIATLYILILFIIIRNLSIIADAFLIKIHKEKQVFIINFFYSIIFLGWHLYVLYDKYDLNRLIWGSIIITAGKCLAMLFFKWKTLPEPQQIEEDKVFSKHWLYLGLNDITSTFSKWLDKLFLLYLLIPADFAIYFNGSFEIPLLASLISTLSTIVVLKIAENKTEIDKVTSLFSQNFKILSAIVFPLFLFFLFYPNELYSFLFNDRYNDSIPIFIVSILIVPLRINDYYSILQCYSKGNVIITGSLIDICLGFILMIVLYPLMGTIGIALAVVISTYCEMFYYLWQSSRIIKVSILDLFPVKYLFLNMVILTAASALVYFLLIDASPVFRLMIGGIFTAICIVAGLYYFYRRKLTF